MSWNIPSPATWQILSYLADPASGCLNTEHLLLDNMLTSLCYLWTGITLEEMFLQI